MKISKKDIFAYLVFIWFFQCQIIAQAPTSLCLDAPIMCDLDDLDGFSGTMSAIPTLGPNPLCSSTMPNNMHWWAFVANGTVISIDVLLSNCTLESGMMGANFGVYESCSFGTPVWCSDFCFDGLSTNLPITGLTIGQSYYLYMDGCNGSVCDYTFAINSGGGGVVHPNDACSGAIGLTDGISVTGATNVCATPDYDDCSNGGNTNTVWYSFTLGPSDNSASFIITSNDDGISDFNAELYTDCAGSFVASNCSNADGMLVEFSCLIPNTTYFLQIGTDEINASANYEILPDFFDAGGFDSCTDPNLLSPISCGVTLSEIENITGFCPEFSDLGTSCSFSTTSTAWYEFSVPPGEEIFSITNHTGPGYALFNMQCPTGSPIGNDCFMGDHDYDVSAGGTFYLAMMGDGAGDYIFDYSFNYQGGACGLATDLGPLDLNCIQNTFTGVPESCPDGAATGCMSGMDGSWYTFTLNASLGTEIEVEDLDGGSAFEIYTGTDCNNLTRVSDCQLSFSANVGNQYWVFLSQNSLIALTSCPCDITNVLPIVNCLDNSTTDNNLDDIIEVSLQVAGQNLGSSYGITTDIGSITPQNGNYLTLTTFQLQAGSAGSGDVMLTLTDDVDPNCTFTLTITDPGSCSPDCAIVESGLTNIDCDDNLSPDNNGDDLITFDLNPSGFNLGSIYSVSSTSGAVIPTSGFYGETTSFSLDPGTAGGGNVTITLQDVANIGCDLDDLIIDPGSCSSDVGGEITYSISNTCLAKERDFNFGGTATDNLTDVLVLDNSDYLFVGTSESSDQDVSDNFGSTDVWVYRWNEVDGIIWERNYGGSLEESFSKILALPNNEFLIACNSFSSDGDVSANYGDQDVWLFKIDETGNIIWEQNFGGSQEEIFNDFIAVGNNEYVIVGSTQSNDVDVSNNYGGVDGWMVKIDGLGNIIWERNYGGSGGDRFYAAVLHSNQTFFIGGSSSSQDGDINNSIGSGDGWILNIDQSGNILWEQSYGGTGSEQINEIISLSNGNLVFAGISNSTDIDLPSNYGCVDGWVGMINNAGDQLWSRNIGGSQCDYFWNGAEASNGICFVGNTESIDFDLNSNYGSRDVWLAFLGFDGNLNWSRNYGGPSLDLGNKIEIIGEDNMLLLGNVVSSGNDVSNHYLLEDHWVLEFFGQCSESFITTWQTDNPGVSCNSCVTIPTFSGETYAYDVDWENDGVFDDFGVTGSITHDYLVPGEYSIAIRGDFPRIYFNLGGDREKIISIEQWGNIQWSSMESAFAGCTNLMGNAADTPNLSNVTELQSMFLGASSFNQDINAWDVSNITNMNGMFFQASNFNQSLNDWDVSNVINMINMFYEASSFNGNIADWDISNVNSMFGMFVRASVFNGDLSGWDVSNVQSLNNLFEDAISFNQSLNAWDVSNCTDFSAMFFNASSFDQSLGSWNVGAGIEFQNMFEGASSFNQDLSNWNVANANRMSAMFRSASAFDHSLENWNLTSVNNNDLVFDGIEAMLDNSGLSRNNYEATLNAWATNPNTPNNLELGALSLQYCDETGRNILLIDNTWTITGDVQSCDQRPFITTWTTDNSGTSCNSCVLIPTNPAYVYSYDIDWENDGVYDEFGLTGNATHDYGALGTYTIAIRGDFPHFFFETDAEDNDKLIEINQWGDMQWSNMSKSFFDCNNVNILADDAPVLDLVTNMSSMFHNATSMNVDLNTWDVSGVEDMSFLFYNAATFNQILNNWDVSNVLTMEGMFANTVLFNGSIENWDVSNVINMSSMFASSLGFNRDISSWDVGTVSDMEGMFAGTLIFNTDLNIWDVSNVQNMSRMFMSANGFNQNLTDWNLSSLTNAENMLDNGPMSSANYEVTLNGWASNPNTPNNLNLGSLNLEYCDDSGRNMLINDKGWVINGDLKSCDNCPNFADNCNDPSIVTLSPTTNTNMLDFECAVGCIENASPVIGITDCGFDFRPTVWFQLQTDASAVQTFVRVNTACGWDPVYAIFKSSSGDCTQELDLVFSAGFPGCSLNWADPSGFSQGLEANTIYWIGVGTSFFEDGMCDDFELCVATSLIEVPCFGDGTCSPLSTNQTSNSLGQQIDPANDALSPGETYTICESFFYDSSESGSEWLMGIVPFFEGWDLSDFDPQNVTITGNGIQATWYEEVYLQETLNNVCTYTDESGRLQLCNTLCDVCPCTPPSNQGDLLPGGWYWTNGSSDCTNDGHPNNSWGIGMDQVMVDFCLDLQTPNYIDLQDCEANTNLKFGFQTFSDGVVGCWDDPVGECLIDESQFINYTLDCSSLNQNSFITTWKTDNIGTSCNSCVSIPTNTSAYTYNYDIDWENDGVFDEFGLTGDALHDYGLAGTYEIAIRGEFPHLNHQISSDNPKLVDVNQWGDIVWNDLSFMFADCENLANFSATDVPNLSGVNRSSACFQNASNFNGNIESWDMSNITNTSFMFSGASAFNSPLENWDVSSVQDMTAMFNQASSFNQTLNGWNTISVTVMNGMFLGATSFNRPINDWDVSNTVDFGSMFTSATNFNQTLEGWNTSSAISMQSMFADAVGFNGNISSWNVSAVENTSFMFSRAVNFNADLSSWNMENVVDASFMFFEAAGFDQDLSLWRLNTLNIANNMFDNCGLSTANYENALLAWSQNISTVSGINLGVENLVYCDEEGRDGLINDYGWTFIGDNQDPACACPPVNAGDSFDANYCQGQSAVDLAIQMFNFDPNGVWEDPLNTGLDLSNILLVDVGTLSDGDYYFYYIVGEEGCPMDTNIVNFTVHPMYDISISETICFGESVTIGTETFNTTGIHNVALSTAENCDSLIELDLVVLPQIEGEWSASGCPGDIYIINGENFTFADVGPYEETQILQSIEFPECDSILTITMNVKEDIEVDFTGFICGDETIDIGGMNFDKEFPNGDVFLLGSNFCDSIVHVDLIHVDSIELVGSNIALDGNTLSIDVLSDATYDNQLNYTIEAININEDKILNIESSAEFGVFDIEFFPNVESIVSIEFEMCHESCNICDTAIWNINKTIAGYTELVITCNGDGVNDRLIMSEFIENLETEFPCNKIIIFNRWGQPVYEAAPYANDWCGTYMNTGNPIPEGSYYFTLDLLSPESNCTGSDQAIQREFIYGVITLLR